MKIKKGIFTILLTLTSVLTFAQFTNCKLADIKAFEKSTVVVAITNDEATNKIVKEVMTAYWKVNKFNVIKKSELEAFIAANPENYVLTYLSDFDSHIYGKKQNPINSKNNYETPNMQIIGDCLILTKNLKKVGGLTLTDAMINCYSDYEMQIVNEHAEFIRQVGTINSILTFPNLQDSQIGGWKIPTLSQKEVVEKELWIADVDLNKKEEQVKLKEAYLLYKYKVVSKEEIAKAILEKRKDIVYLAREQYKLDVNLFLIHSPENNRVLFFTKGEGLFDSKGFENIRNNKPHAN